MIVLRNCISVIIDVYNGYSLSQFDFVAYFAKEEIYL